MRPDYRTRAEYVIVACLITVHVAMLAFSAVIHSPAWVEPAHLVAGVSHWEFSNFRVFHVNPPLVRMVAALPVLLSDPKTEWSSYRDTPTSRPEVTLGRDFVTANGPRAFHLFTLARWVCIPFSILGALVSWYWARALYGSLAGIGALTLWAFCPNILAYGQLITLDVPTASVGLFANFLFWRSLRNPSWKKVPLLGVVFGLAQLTKFTWVILFGLWPMMWIIWTAGQQRRIWSQALQLAVCFLIGIYVINLGYGFTGSLTKLGDFGFISHALRGDTHSETAGNRFRGTVFEHVPIPLPRDYVAGFDSQKSDFDRGMASYLRGTWRERGWWYYYLYGLTIKVPLGTWLIVLLAVALTVMEAARQTGQSHFAPKDVQNDPVLKQTSQQSCLIPQCEPVPRSSWRDEAILLLPALAVFVLVSSQTGFSHHFRYVLPCLPFLFIWASKVARSVQLHAKSISVVAAFALLWSVLSSLWIYPHSLSYFNELVGGPKGGHWHLADSNMDWGQDLLILKRWYDAHPEARPLHLGYDQPLVSPSIAGIDWQPVPEGPVLNRPGSPTTKNWPWDQTPIDTADSQENIAGPAPGWHAISVNRIHRREGDYEYFLEFEPVDMIGYSMYIYHITPDEANRVRMRLGLPEFTESQAPNK